MHRLDTGDDREWLEADGLGGFASGPVLGARTRRYHALLLVATSPPVGRVVLVNGLEGAVTTVSGTWPLSTQHYAPDVIHPRGDLRVAEFSAECWPRWRFRLDDGTEVEHELFVPHGHPAIVLRWRVTHASDEAAGNPIILTVRPLLSGRDYHALHHENDAVRLEPSIAGQRVAWSPYDGIPAVVALSNGRYAHAPLWYRNFFYRCEAYRGLDATEDLVAPGEFLWDLTETDAVLILAADGVSDALPLADHDAMQRFADLRQRERGRRGAFADSLARAADAYIVRRGAGRTIMAGYPWFTDWGRDTFIAMRGLCLATQRWDDARDILLAWSNVVSHGMLPNRFPDHGEQPEFNSVDASLWFVVAVHELLSLVDDPLTDASSRGRLLNAVRSIVDGYTHGTRYGIRVTEDGLLAAGEQGVQLTWMDAKVGDWVVTPRIGKGVEVQALWLNTLWIALKWIADEPAWRALFERGRASFIDRFWDDGRGYLYDVVDVDHTPGAVDLSLRPNQILAVGGLPLAILDGDKAQRVVRAVERSLLTPMGLRSLAPDSPQYCPRYEGGVWQRDRAYHQGTVWPWLMGPFVEAWLHVQSDPVAARRVARERFLEPLRLHLQTAGLGHVSEIADAEAPYVPRGCPFQAWSVGELLRLDRIVLADPPTGNRLDPLESAAAPQSRTMGGPTFPTIIPRRRSS